MKPTVSPEREEVVRLLEEARKVYLSGDYKDAEGLYLDAMDILRQIPNTNKDLMFDVTYGLAAVNESMGEYDIAKTYYDEAIRIAREHLGDLSSTLVDLYVDASRHAELGRNYWRAWNLLGKALTICNHRPDPECYEEKVRITRDMIRVQRALNHINGKEV